MGEKGTEKSLPLDKMYGHYYASIFTNHSEDNGISGEGFADDN